MSRLFAVANHVDSDDWYTPEWIFDGLGLTFDLDVAAPDAGVSWIPARQSFSIAADGLAQPWHGLVWCNPPYSAPLKWCYRWADHDAGLILLRTDLSTRGPFAAFTAATSIYVPSKRLQFVSAFGHPSGAANFSSVLLGRGRRADQGIRRLADKYGGAGRTLRAVSA